MSSKHGKINDLDGAPDYQPSTVLSKDMLPKVLGEIPKLLLVDLQQQNDADEVVEVLRKFRHILGSEDEDEEECPTEVDALKDPAKIALDIGAPSLLSLIMTNWVDNESILCWCFRCMARLAYSTEGSYRIALSGGVDHIVFALMNFPGSVELQDFGFSALNQIFCELDKDPVPAPIQEQAERFLKDLDGMKLVRKAMTEFADHGSLQSTCCNFLGRLAYEKNFHRLLIQGGAATMAGAALENHFEAGEAHENAIYLLKALVGLDNGEVVDT